MSQPKPVKTQILYKPNFFKVPLYEMFVNLTYIIPVNLWELLGGRSPPYQLF